MRVGLFVCAILTATVVCREVRAGETAVSVTPFKAGAVITLEQAYDRTLATDQTIRTAYVQIKKAHLDFLTAYTKLLPTVNGVASRYWQSNAATGALVATGATGGGIGTSTSRVDSYNTLGVIVQQPLLDLSFFPARKLGLASQAGARYDYRQQIRVTLIGVAQAYYNVLTAERVVEEDRLALKLSQEQLDLSQKQAKVGLVTETDVLNAQVVVDTAKQALVTDINGLALDKNTLANTLNLPADFDYKVASPPDYAVKLPIFPAVLAKAMARREDLLSREEAIKHDVAAKNEVVAQYIPTITSQVEGFRTNQLTGTDRYANEWQANITLNIPFFNGGVREIALANANYQVEQTKLSRDTVAKTVEQDVKTAWLNIKTLIETLDALRSQVMAAEKSYKDLQIQYKAGISTSVDVLVALNALNLARRTLAQETFALQVALRAIEQVSGVFQEDRVNRAPLPHSIR